MISGRKSNAAVALLTLLGACVAVHAAVPPELTRLLGVFAAQRSGRASFHARTYAKGVNRPLVSSGMLSYTAPDRLEQHTLAPTPSEMILQGEHLTLRRGSQVRRLDLREYPQVAAYVDALRDTLSGNARALHKHFDITFTGTFSRWRLALTPKTRDTEVSRIELRGRQGHIRTIEILTRSGARTVMRIGPPSAP